MTNGIILMILVAFFQTILVTLAKSLSTQISSSLAGIAYYLIPLMIYIPIIKQQGIMHYYCTRKEVIFFCLRGFLASLAVFCLFKAANHTDLGVAVVLFNSTPVFVAIASIILLKEKLTTFSYGGILLSMLGVYIILKPTSNGLINLWTAVALLSGVVMSLSIIMLRYLSIQKISTDKIVFYLYLMASLWTVVYLFAEGIYSDRSVINLFAGLTNKWWVIPGLLIFGLISVVSQKIMTLAFRLIPATIATPFLFVSVPLSALLGNIFWDQVLNYKELIGIIMVIFGVSITVLFKEGFKDAKAQIRSA